MCMEGENKGIVRKYEDKGFEYKDAHKSECNIEVCMSVWKWKLCWEQIVIICDVKREGKIRKW